jgi:hypothetical protein
MLDALGQELRPPTLGDALDAVGTGFAFVGDLAAHRARSYSGVQFYDAFRPDSEYRDCLVLCAGLDPDSVADVEPRLRAAGAVALVVPGRSQRGAPDRTRPAPARRPQELPTLVLRRGDWAQLANVLRSLARTSLLGHVGGVRVGDLFGLANAVASLAAGAVSLVDATGQVVGYSTHSEQPIDDVRRRTTLMLQEETALALDADYRAVLASDRPMHFPATDAAGTGEYGRVAIAVRAAGEFLGTVWVVQIDASSAPRTEQLLGEIAPIVAEHLLQARERAADDDRRASELLRTLVEDEGNARSAASQLLVSPADGCTVVCFRLDTADEVAMIRGLHRLRMLVKSLTSTAFLTAHSATIGPQVATLITGTSAERVGAFAASVARTDPAVVAGIGTPVRTAVGIGRSYREAVESAILLLSSPAHATTGAVVRIATFEEVRDRLAIRRAGDVIGTLDAVVGDAASRVLDHDRRHGTELAVTVLTYLNLQGSVRLSASALHVHQNTVRYRLDVVRREVGIDLDDAATRLWLWLRLATSTDDTP